MSNKNEYYLSDILVVEDEEDHSRLIINALKTLGQLRNKIILLENGQEAVDYLNKTGKYADSDHHLPMLVLLDIKMPLKNGFEVLEDIKSDNDLKKIPVVVLTTTSNSKDIEKALELGANDCITKPVKFEDFKSKVNNLGYYWGIISDTKMVFK